MTKQTWPRIKHVTFILAVASIWVWLGRYNVGSAIIVLGSLHLGVIAHAHWPTSKRVPSAAVIAKYGSFGYDCCSDYGCGCGCDRNRG